MTQAPSWLPYTPVVDRYPNHTVSAGDDDDDDADDDDDGVGVLSHMDAMRP